MIEPTWIGKDGCWAIEVQPPYPTADGEADGYINVWNDTIIDGPSLRSPEEIEEFISQLRQAKQLLWP